MKKATMIAVTCAMLLLVAGAYVTLTMNGASNKAVLPPADGSDGGDNNAGDQNDAPAGNLTLAVPFPMTMDPDDARVGLVLDYPGKGQEETHDYSWNRPYEFRLTSSPLDGYQGRVLTKVFADKFGEIGPKCLIITTGEERAVDWAFNVVEGENIISGDVGNWTSDGSLGDDVTFGVIFNRTGDYDLIFQAFDLDSGKPLSAPLKAGPLRVPVDGALQIIARGPGSYQTGENGTHYVVLLNITNGWNTRYVVDASYLVLDNGTSETRANLSAMSFLDQSLAIGQSTQFLAYFDVTGDIGSFRLRYEDQGSGQDIEVPLG